MSGKKKVLFITTQLPYPPHSGGAIKSWKLCEMLAAHYDLGVACLLKGTDAEHIEEFRKKIALSDFFAVPLEVHRNASNLIKANLQGIPLNLYRNKSRAFSSGVNDLAKKYDVLFIDHYEMYQYVPGDFNGKVVLHQHNCEYLLWERFGKLDPNPLKKAVLYNQAWHIRRYEKKITRKADAILAAPNDREELVKIGAPPGKFFETFHLGDTEWLDAVPLDFDKAENALFFVGTLTWEANVDGLLWMLDKVWPELSQKEPHLQFFIVGKNPDQRLVDMVSDLPEVHLEGFREDLDEYYRKAKIFVAPLRFGSGTKVKVMNALYRGIPTITTRIGIEGIAAEHKEHIWLAEDPPEWVEGITTLLHDKDQWQSLSHNSRQLSAEKYTWDVVMENARKAIG